MKTEKKSETVSPFNKTTTIITIALIGTLLIGAGLLYKPPSTIESISGIATGPGPPNIDITDNQPVENETETTSEPTNATSPETDEISEITNTTDVSPEIPQFNKTTTIIEVTAEELLWNGEISFIYPSNDKAEKAKEWLTNLKSAEFIRVTGILISQEVEELEDLKGNKYWVIYLGGGRTTKIKVILKDAVEIQKFKDLNLNEGDELQIEGKYGGTTSMGGSLLGDCKIIQRTTNP